MTVMAGHAAIFLLPGMKKLMTFLRAQNIMKKMIKAVFPGIQARFWHGRTCLCLKVRKGFNSFIFYCFF